MRRLDALVDRWVGAAVESLGDAGRSHFAAAGLIALYVLLWWSYGVVAQSTQGIHYDMGEVFSWSLEPAFGYPKHPAFPAWVVAAWFAVFPRADWAFYLLSITSIGVALWFTWLISARVTTTGRQRAVALLLLGFAPTYNFLALKFNYNSILIPVWALASWLFLRSFQERTLLWGVLAGLGAAVAMLTKYWSFFLLLAFIAAALTDPRRWEYLRSPAPWASVVTGAVLFAPNVVSLIHYDFSPFHYAVNAHEAPSYVDALASISHYLAGVFYLTGSFVVLAFIVRSDVKAWRDMLWPHGLDRRLLLRLTCLRCSCRLPLRCPWACGPERCGPCPAGPCCRQC